MSSGGAVDALFERGAELEREAEMLSAAAEGQGGILLVEGPAGIGKSALLRAVRERAGESAATVLAARGAELERDFSFGVVRQLFEPLLAEADDATRSRLLAGAARFAEPAIGELDAAPSPEEHEAPAADTSFTVLHGLYWLTANLAEDNPLLLVVDDLHWADLASLRFLSYVAGRLDGVRALVVAAVRTGEPEAPRELLAAIEAEASTEILRPAALSERASGELLRLRTGTEPEPVFVTACHQATKGNPELIRELLAALAADEIEPNSAAAEHIASLGAGRVADSVLVRLGKLGGPAIALVNAVAVLGGNATLELVGAISGLTLDEAAAAAEALVAVEILEPGEVLAFVHPIVRTAIYRDINRSLRAEMHGRAARLLAERDAPVDAIAAQIVAAPASDDAWAQEILQEAGAAALARGAPEAAVTYLERALAEGPERDLRRECLVALGRALAMLAEPRRSLKRLREALEATDDPLRRAEIAHLMAASLTISPAANRAVELLDSELRRLPDSAQELGLRLESDIDSTTHFSLEAKRAAELHEVRFSDPDDQRVLAGAAMRAALYGGTAEEAAGLAKRATHGGRLLRAEGVDSPIVWTAGYSLLYSHELSEARELADAWVRDASRRGSRRAFILASSLRARAAHWLGELADAEADARVVFEGMPGAVAIGPAFLADALADQGRLDEAEAALGPAGRAELDVDWSFFYPSLLLTRGNLQMLRGDLEQARESLLACGEVLSEWGVSSPAAIQWRPAAAEVLFRLGEKARAADLIERELESCRAYGSARALGIALCSAGRAQGGEPGAALLAEATAVLAGSGARLEHARALVELGAALRRLRRPAEAREPLREGLAIARACGAVGLAERAHEELAASGVRTRKLVRAGTEALTASEQRVARMAAGGMTNKQIAQELFVTVRTVEAHLHHTYRKLDISSRRELSGALDGDQAADG